MRDKNINWFAVTAIVLIVCCTVGIIITDILRNQQTIACIKAGGEPQFGSAQNFDGCKQ